MKDLGKSDRLKQLQSETYKLIEKFGIHNNEALEVFSGVLVAALKSSGEESISIDFHNGSSVSISCKENNTSSNPVLANNSILLH
jgi:hypothetical protein